MPKGKKKSCKALKTSEEGDLSGFVLNNRPKLNENLTASGLLAGLILGRLYYSDCPLSISRLSDITCYSRQNTHQISNRLAAAGLIDKDAGKCTLTEAGRKEVLILRSYLFNEPLPVLYGC